MTMVLQNHIGNNLLIPLYESTQQGKLYCLQYSIPAITIQQFKALKKLVPMKVLKLKK